MLNPIFINRTVSLASSFMSDLYGRRGLTISFFATISIVGFAMFLGTSSRASLTIPSTRLSH